MEKERRGIKLDIDLSADDMVELTEKFNAEIAFGEKELKQLEILSIQIFLNEMRIRLYIILSRCFYLVRELWE